LFNARVIGLLGAVADYGFLYRTISSSIANDMQLSCVFVKKKHHSMTKNKKLMTKLKWANRQERDRPNNT